MLLYSFAIVAVTIGLFANAQTQTDANGTCPGVTKCLERLDQGLECGPIPIPKRALIPPLPVGAPYVLHKLREGVWAIQDFAYLSMIVRHEDRVILIDAPDSRGGLNKPDGSQTRLTDIVNIVLNGTTLRLLDIVYSHAHFDHIGASLRVVQWARRLPVVPKIRVFGAPNIDKLITRSVTKRSVTTTHIIPNDGKTLYVRNGLRIELRYVGGHTDRDLAVYFPKKGKESSILMHVDVVFPGYAPFWALGISHDVRRFISVHTALLKYDFDYFVSGHLRLGNRTDIEENKKFAEDLFDAAMIAPSLVTQEQLNQVGISDVADPTQPEFNNVWFLALTAGRSLQARICSRIMVEKWGCKVGGISETIFSNCFVMLSYIGIEYWINFFLQRLTVSLQWFRKLGLALCSFSWERIMRPCCYYTVFTISQPWEDGVQLIVRLLVTIASRTEVACKSVRHWQCARLLGFTTVNNNNSW